MPLSDDKTEAGNGGELSIKRNIVLYFDPLDLQKKN